MARGDLELEWVEETCSCYHPHNVHILDTPWQPRCWLGDGVSLRHRKATVHIACDQDNAWLFLDQNNTNFTPIPKTILKAMLAAN